VTFHAGIVRSVPIALAPFVLAPMSLWWAATFLAPANGLSYAAHAWVVGALLSASLPSAADFRIAIPALAILAAIIAIAWAMSI
jgi:hypothetical protein